MRLEPADRIAGPLLVVCAHPDDIEIHAGGLAALRAAAGETVDFVVVTSGDRGTADPRATREAVGAVREAEQRHAATALGVERVTFLRLPDGDVQYETRALREQLVRLIRERRPRTVITHDPYGQVANLDACRSTPITAPSARRPSRRPTSPRPGRSTTPSSSPTAAGPTSRTACCS